MDDIQKQIALLKTGMDKSFKKPVSKEITQPLQNIDEGITNLKDKETSDEGLTVNFGALKESLEKIAEGITDLNNNISELLKVEVKEGKESRADQVDRMQDAFETEKNAGGVGSDAAILDEIKDNLQRNFLKEFKVLEMIERNTQGGMGGGGTTFIPGLPDGPDRRGGTRKGKVGTSAQRNTLAQDLKDARSRGASKEEIRKIRETGKAKMDTPSVDPGKGAGKGMLSKVGGAVKTVGKAALRFAGPLALAATAGLSAYQGAGRAGEFFGKDQEDATGTEKTAGAIGQIASDFTLGLVDPKEFAIKTKEFLEAINKFFMEEIPKFFTETLPAFFTEKFQQLKEIFPQTFKVITDDIPKFFTETVPEKIGEAVSFLKEKIVSISATIMAAFKNIGIKIANGIRAMILAVAGETVGGKILDKLNLGSEMQEEVSVESKPKNASADKSEYNNVEPESAKQTPNNVTSESTKQTSVALKESTEELDNANESKAETTAQVNNTVNQITNGAQTTSVVTLKPNSRNSPNPLSSSVAMAQARNMDFGVY